MTFGLFCAFARKTQPSATEHLEERTLPAVSVLLIGGTELNIASDDGDAIRVRSIAGNVLVETAAPGGPFAPNQSLGTVASANIQSLIINGGDDENTIDVSNVLAADFLALTHVEVHGFHGDDTLIGSPDFANQLFGDDGDDRLSGGNQADTLDGSDGNDFINGEGGDDTILGGGGNDSAQGGAGRDSILGEAGDDTLRGQSGRDTVIGGAGNDVVDGGDDDDFAQSESPDGPPSVLVSISDDQRAEGNFTSVFGLFSTFAAHSATFVRDTTVQDFDGDGDLDIALPSDSGVVGLMLNDGAGNFSQGQQLTIPQTFAFSITSGDYDGDDDIDIAVPNWGTQTISLFFNSGNATFGAAIPIPLAGVSFPRGTASADFDLDGDIDIAVANSGIGTISILRNDGTGNFTRLDVSLFSQFFNSPNLILADDVDGDGDADLVVNRNGSGLILGVMLNTAGSFGPISVTNFGSPNDGVLDFATLDADADGDRDVALVTSGATPQMVLLTNDGTGRFAVASTQPTFFTCQFVDTGDVNSDGTDDVLGGVAGGGFNPLQVFFGNGDGSFQPRLDLSLPNPGDSGGAVMARDFNGDGLLDIAQAHFFGPELYGALNVFQPPRVTLTVSLSQVSSVPVTVEFSTADGSASAGSDYAATFGTVTFAPGETSKTIIIPTRIDSNVEPTENFYVNLRNPTNAGIADGQGQVVLTDDDGGAAVTSISITDVAINPEGNGGTTNAVFTRSLNAARNAASANPITVNFSTADGTAIAGFDYQPLSAVLTFLREQSRKRSQSPSLGMAARNPLRPSPSICRIRRSE